MQFLFGSDPDWLPFSVQIRALTPVADGALSFDLSDCIRLSGSDSKFIDEMDFFECHTRPYPC
jgi:hypothetical protein